MGGGGPFIPRTQEQIESIPASADAALAVGSGVVSASAVAPFLMCVDKAVVSYTASGRGLFQSILTAASELISKPRASSRALSMVVGVYGLTYAVANLADVASERHDEVEPPTSAACKFFVTTAANMGSSLFKDAAFARMFGSAGPAAAVPMASYILFAGRDCVTIGGAFFVPQMVAASVQHDNEETALVASQLLAPATMQLVAAPLHVLALQLVNVPHVESFSQQRLPSLVRVVPSVLLARSLRMLPAYGIGGIMNGALLTNGRQWIANYYCPHLQPDTSPEDYHRLPVTFLYGQGVHPVMLAREWALLIGGQDVVQFIKEHDEDGDGKLNVIEVEHILEDRGLHEGARELVAFADQDGDGFITADELKVVLSRRYSTSHTRDKW